VNCDVMATGCTGVQENPRLVIGFEPVGVIWDLNRGFHHGQRPVAPRKQAGHMTAPNQTPHQHFSLASGGPSTHDDPTSLLLGWPRRRSHLSGMSGAQPHDISETRS